MVRVRRGESRDLPAVHELVRELAIYEKAEEEFTASLQDYYRDFEKGVFHILVAEESEQVIGMALYYLAYSTWKGKMLYLEDFVVQEAQRRRGVGQMLFDALAEEAKQMGCRLLKWQVLDWNSPAIAFYEKQSATIEQGWWNGKIFLSNPLA